MSMLAEKRVKEKWCQDPRNTRWSNGEFSYRQVYVSSYQIYSDKNSHLLEDIEVYFTLLGAIQ